MIQMPFEDRISEGNVSRMNWSVGGSRPTTIVVGVTCGGVPVAYKVAYRLRFILRAVAARRVAVQPEITPLEPRMFPIIH